MLTNSRRINKLITLWAIFNVADLILTLWGKSKDGFEEQNILMKPVVEYPILAIALKLLVIYVMFLLFKRLENNKVAVPLAFSIMFLYAYVVEINTIALLFLLGWW